MNSTKVIFITGTDTDAGKTVVSEVLLHALANAGKTTAALKPVAAGVLTSSDRCGPGDVGYNEDALRLQRAATLKHDYAQVNPYLFEPAIAPHIAAEQVGVEIDLQDCVQCCQPVLAAGAEVVVVEGAGGWLVPLNSTHSMADLAVALESQVILVVGMRLGCINHALLTVESIARSGLPLLGWVANHLQPNMDVAAANVATLKQRIASPLLAQLPYAPGSPAETLADNFVTELL